MCCIERQQSPFIFLVSFLNYFFERTLTYVLSPKPSVNEPKANKGLKTENTVSQQMFRSVLG